ncbi:hypothetical protein PBAL39_07635 [Pedobacter sp. BAL39]|nr:hypothetical protein [Pedobacter sp. BAL39]EDM35541.1 hypothetical protein PBAL39_07635 [Pedobacter sp. BAL39]
MTRKFPHPYGVTGGALAHAGQIRAAEKKEYEIADHLKNRAL